ncbi:glyoxalase superfamily protein [uncultured Cohaesibacter sp.]|uniref:glyoxalase superfamily protein n=1 Tax=uncultured Cohaesibacter sp. TaxID=1002546 RepID=UPI00292D8C42|nr:glyoxalase superfamily protein [uncultured Cohaesibacter sp.]
MSSDTSINKNSPTKARPASLAEAKRQAKLLRSELQKDGINIAHSKSLELIAQQYGYRDWNTLFAQYGNQLSRDWQIGDRVSGLYLSQPFEAIILAVQKLADGRHRLTFQFDEPVDVITFESMSNFRSRTSQVIGPDGTTREKTSNGQPHMILDL